MSDYLSESSRRALAGLLGQQEAPAQNAPATLTFGLVKRRDPLEDVEKLVDLLDNPTGKRRPNNWLKRQHNGGREPLGVSMGRKCCLAFAGVLEQRLALLQIGSEHTCPECGTVWALDIQMQGGR